MNYPEIEDKYQQVLSNRLQERLTKWQCENWKRMCLYLKSQLQQRCLDVKQAQQENLATQVHAKKCRDDLQARLIKASQIGKKIVDKVHDQHLVCEFIEKKEKEMTELNAKLCQNEEQLEEHRKLLQDREVKLKEAEDDVDQIRVNSQAEDRPDSTRNSTSSNALTLATIQERGREVWRKTSQVLNTANLGLLSNQEVVDQAKTSINETDRESQYYVYALLGISAVGIAFISAKKSGAF